MLRRFRLYWLCRRWNRKRKLRTNLKTLEKLVYSQRIKLISLTILKKSFNTFCGEPLLRDKEHTKYDINTYFTGDN